MLTTTEAAAYLNERGGFPYVVTRQLVQQWCKRGKFAHAIAPANRRGLWQIPTDDLDSFVLPRRTGRKKRTEGENR